MIIFYKERERKMNKYKVADFKSTNEQGWVEWDLNCGRLLIHFDGRDLISDEYIPNGMNLNTVQRYLKVTLKLMLATNNLTVKYYNPF